MPKMYELHVTYITPYAAPLLIVCIYIYDMFFLPSLYPMQLNIINMVDANLI